MCCPVEVQGPLFQVLQLTGLDQLSHPWGWLLGLYHQGKVCCPGEVQGQLPVLLPSLWSQLTCARTSKASSAGMPSQDSRTHSSECYRQKGHGISHPLTPLGLTHWIAQARCRTYSPACCSCRGAGPVTLLSCSPGATLPNAAGLKEQGVCRGHGRREGLLYTVAGYPCGP